MSTSQDHPLDFNVKTTFSQSANRDGDIPSVSEISCRWQIIIHLFDDQTITTLLVIFCFPVSRDQRLTDFIVSALSILLGIDVVLACREVSSGWVLTDALVRPPLLRIPMWCNGGHKDVPIGCGGKNSRILSTRSQPEIEKLNSIISSQSKEMCSGWSVQLKD
jgi:hypothetical protein